MSDREPDLQLMLRQQEQMMQDHAALRDDMRVMRAILMGVDNTLAALLTEVRAMHGRPALEAIHGSL